jgi:type I restriction enzyme M protein
MNSFGKTRPLTLADFAEFEAAFGDDPLGRSPRVDQGEEGRFRCFSREQIADRNDNLDIAWLRDTSNDPEDEMTQPEEIAGAIALHLRNALSEIESFTMEIEKSS